MTNSIFVSIAVYRDPEWKKTIQNLFDKAKYPENITIAVILQCDFEADDFANTTDLARPGQVIIDKVPHVESKGCCWARHRAQQHCDDQKYTLQIDSHCRFVSNWDQKLFNQLKQIDNNHEKKSLLCSHLPGYELDGKLHEHTYISKGSFKADEYSCFFLTPIVDDFENRSTPIPAAFSCGHFIFGPSQWIKDVPYDPYLYFMGEEISLSARLWTHGWNLFHPHEKIAYHLYDDNPDKPSNNRQKFWHDTQDWRTIDIKSKERVQYLLAGNLDVDDEILIEIDHYGLGNARTLYQFQHHCGVNFSSRKMSAHSRLGIFQTYQPQTLNPIHTLNLKQANLLNKICANFNITSLIDIDHSLRHHINSMKQLQSFYAAIGDISCYQSALNRFTNNPNQHALLLNPLNQPLLKADAIIYCPEGSINLDSLRMILSNAYQSGCMLALVAFDTNKNTLTDDLPGALVTCELSENYLLGIWSLKESLFYAHSDHHQASSLRIKLIPELQSILSTIQRTLINGAVEHLYPAFLHSFTEKWEDCNAWYEGNGNIEKIKSLDKERSHDLRNTLFRLVYGIEFNQLPTNIQQILQGQPHSIVRLVTLQFILDQIDLLEKTEITSNVTP